MPTPFVVNAGFRGDFIAGATIDFNFTTTDVGVPFALAGTPAVSVYKDSSLTQSTAGVTLTASFDSVTGLNHVTIDTSSDGTFYAAGHQFDVVITTGTVNAGSVVGYVVGSFSTRAGAANGPLIAGSNAATTLASLTATGDFAVGGNLAITGNLTAAEIIGAIQTAAAAAFWNSYLDLADAVETGLTVRQAKRLGGAADGGLLSGAGTVTQTIKGAGVDTVRIVATVDPNGNRQANTLSL